MFKNFHKFILIGIVFTIILGCILHFVYEWSGNNSFVGLICQRKHCGAFKTIVFSHACLGCHWLLYFCKKKPQLLSHCLCGVSLRSDFHSYIILFLYIFYKKSNPCCGYFHFYNRCSYFLCGI